MKSIQKVRIYFCLDICKLPLAPNEGEIRCMAYIPRYFYNSTSKLCQKFIFGGKYFSFLQPHTTITFFGLTFNLGCNGNANNFETEK